MSEQQQQTQFKAWAVVEMFGHQKVAGYVTTEYFGQAALFRVDVPELPERTFTLEQPEYSGGDLLPKGTKVTKPKVGGYSKLLGPGAIYSMNPTTEEAVRKLLENGSQRPLKVLELPAGQRALPEAEDEDVDDDLPY